MSNLLMKQFQLILILLFVISVVQNNFAQNKNDKFITVGIINGRALNLPKPVYPQEANDFCIGGEVKVEVLLNENGSNMTAVAISGDELLRDSAVEAAKKAKFGPTMEIPVKVKGVIVYNFVPEKKCFTAGIVNKKALSLPIPKIPNLEIPRIIKETQIIIVRILVDESGQVISTKAVTSHALLRSACEFSARQTKFSPTNGVGRIMISGLLIYKFKADGTIDTDIGADDKDVIKTLTRLVKPPSVSCDCKFGSRSTVSVQIETDSQGNIIRATAVSGHPVLRLPSEKAALASKILPNNSGTVLLIYHFTETGRSSAECADVEIKQVNIVK